MSDTRASELFANTLDGVRMRRDTREMSVREQVLGLYDETRPSLLAYLLGQGVIVSEAEDIVQEAFLRLTYHLLAGKSEANLRGWLFRVAHNLLTDQVRFARRFVDDPTEATALADRLHDSAPNPEQHALENERMRRFHAGLRQLTVHQRQCVMLRAEGLRYREIGQVLGITVQSVADLLERAIGRLAGGL